MAEAARHVIIIGAGGHAKEVSSYLRDLTCGGNPLNLAGCVDDYKPRGVWQGLDILGNFEDLAAFLTRHDNTTFHYITAVGDNTLRRKLVQRVEQLAAPNLTALTLIHPRSTVGHAVKIGAGVLLAPASVVTTQVSVGAHCIVNVNVSIHHDGVLGDWCNVNPGATICGSVTLGAGCYIGAGATLIDNVSVGEWTVVGAGAVVTSDLPAHVTAVGVPARIVKPREA